MPKKFDPREMRVLHSVYRREFWLAPSLIRGVADGDTARAVVVDRHLDLVEGALEEHHNAEDEVLWPLLLDRVPVDVAPLVRRMDAQHQLVTTALSRIKAQRRIWVQEARAAVGVDVAEQYQSLYHALVEHLDDEETNIMPLVAQHLTVAEWRRRARHSSGGKKLSEIPLMFGMMQYEGDAEVIAAMVPQPVRSVLGVLGRRAFGRHSRGVYGTATP